ncbi:hypothetical protein JV173_01885 [Acholeplasma equirhinis]|uniref:hypothetical protein n=1 Tax=Acholeplasma equirhinis TaxID=555393 RepID=UPI00197B0086|nr:hypothetical protein [Acholeplasma equirhinis]MBN3490255.1 hypothetical protein [Acholeplasma equirhinis]
MKQQRTKEGQALVKILHDKLKGLTFQPNFISEIDSDPRYKTLRVIEEKLKKDIDWNWDETDFSSIKGEPIIIEFSANDEISILDACQIIKENLPESFIPMNGGDLLIILNK